MSQLRLIQTYLSLKRFFLLMLESPIFGSVVSNKYKELETDASLTGKFIANKQ